MSLNNKSQSVLLIIGASFLNVINNNLQKYLISSNVSGVLMFFYISAFGMLVMLPVVFFKKNEIKMLFYNKKIALLNFLRGGVGLLGFLFWISALDKVSISQCVAISFTTPLFITLLASIFLKEKVSRMHWVLLFIGFIGTLTILRPTKNLNLYSFYPLFASFLWACSALILKIMSTNYSISSAVFLPKFIKFLIALVVLILFKDTEHYVLQESNLILGLVVISLINLAVVIMMAIAYRSVAISVVIPFDFTRLIFSAIMDYILYAELIGYMTAIGACLIIISSTCIYKRG
ncbi:DMT family transporter [Candidatus Cyrtobacter comes]|uniref:S-adenosylmethionine uptake transporter n=1 Tax=Candidatus Cyrtobacter comes TaxID=675776 RepID=A0ABU5L7L2_9RICK|nr:DMT family transporter [Candidatus Cyrtobacter comes]MDZ5762121.1 DMT family transporter [Candidatus Cyrtobacter comes]